MVFARRFAREASKSHGRRPQNMDASGQQVSDEQKACSHHRLLHEFGQRRAGPRDAARQPGSISGFGIGRVTVPRLESYEFRSGRDARARGTDQTLITGIRPYARYHATSDRA